MFFEKVISLAKRFDILVVHDLAYADVCFDGYAAPSIMQVKGKRLCGRVFLYEQVIQYGWMEGRFYGWKS